MLPLMYIYEINAILFFIKSYKSPTSHFNIKTIYSLAHRMLDLIHLQSWFTTGAPQT